MRGTDLVSSLANAVFQTSEIAPRAMAGLWRRELRIRFCGMLFGVGIAAVGAAVLSAHRNGSAPASPGTIHETAAPASALKVGAELTASERVEATGD
jgi:hypothetical protein